ncbi:hypothetical protein BH11PLA2_BH11PLA2_28590 [soil metagenome]
MPVAELEIEVPPFDIDAIDVPKGYELFDGELVEKRSMSNLATWVAGELYLKLNEWNRTARIGVVLPPESEFACFPERPRDMRKPDGAFVVRDPDGFVPTSEKYKFAPELVIEILSPSNTMGDMFDRFSDYFSAGTKLIWLIDPERRFAQVYYPNFSSIKVSEHEPLSGEKILPGFTMPLTEILPKRAS